jgi:anti-sigma B factor antagonist
MLVKRPTHLYGRSAVEVSIETVNGIGVLELLGETLDMSEVDDLRQQLTSLAARSPKLVIDLNRIQFLDSSGCGALVEGHNRFRAAGGALRLCCPAGEVKTALELARLTRVLNLYDTREQALAAFGT